MKGPIENLKTKIHNLLIMVPKINHLVSLSPSWRTKIYTERYNISYELNLFYLKSHFTQPVAATIEYFLCHAENKESGSFADFRFYV